MKKIFFLSLFLLCTAMSAWSYTTETITLCYHGYETTTDPKTGINVTAAIPRIDLPGWEVSPHLALKVPCGYIITGVKFIYCAEELLQRFGLTNHGIEYCSILVLNGETWEQSDGAFSNYPSIDFHGAKAYVTAVEITYHKHEFLPFEECYHEGVAATCTTPGMMGYLECSDCGHIYEDDLGDYELSKTSLEIPAINHKNKIYVEAKPATDTEDGYTVDHWHCPDCGKNFADEECTEQITENMIIRAKNRDWLCFTANTDNSTVELDKVGDPYEAELEFTTTETTWVPYTFGQTITLTDAGDKVYFRKAGEGVASGFSKSITDYYQFDMSGSIAASGNVMSLLDKTCLATSFPANGTYCFACLFSGCKSLASTPELPAMTLAQDCYYWMFNGCTGLTSAPELPAMTLAYGCYQAMYDNCTGLKQVPALPATTMETFCYAAMFRGCTSLTEAPELSATTLKDYCYSEMFSGCTSLETAPELPVTTLQQSCYDRMFYGCTSLTTAPELPATTLPYRCYDQMFSGCTKLNQVKVAFTEWTNNTTYNWLKDVASTGTFVCPDALDKSQTGASYIPEGWTPAFEVKANNEPETENYYSTFYSGTNAYEVPEGVTAYTGVVEESASNPDESVLKLTAIEGGIIPAEEPVILKATKSQVYLPYTTETAINNPDNKLEGTDVATTLSTNDYALSLGQYGVGFYLWEGKEIGANKAYLTLTASAGAKAFTFQFDDGETTGILKPVMDEKKDSPAYNLNGMRVNDNYKGIVIKNGKKIYQK